MSLLPSYVGARYDSRALHGHVESYFLKANDPRSRRALWIKATIFAPDSDPRRAVAEAWAIAFDGDAPSGHVAVKTTVPFDAARFSKDALDVAVDGCTMTASPREGSSAGRIDTAGRVIGWNLTFEGRGGPLVHFPRAWMYERAFPSSKLVSPLPDLRVSGDVVVNGETWTLDRWPGLLGHNWGRRHANLYAWGHCNAWSSDDRDGARAERDGAPDDLVFEGLSARVMLGRGKVGVLSPTTTLLCVRHRGVRYDVNAVADLVRNRGEITPRRWTFRGANAICRIDGEMWAETDDFVGLHYANPDGAMTYCLNTKIAHARIELTMRGRPPRVVHSRAAALEIGTRDASHGIRMYV
jgi:hypothetical protein